MRNARLAVLILGCVAVALVVLDVRPALPADPARGLATRVTLAEPDITLDRLLARLTTASGVRHRWSPEARFEHVAVFCKASSIAGIHRAVEELLLWERAVREDDGVTVYRFFPSHRLRRETAALLQKQEQEYREQLRDVMHLASLEESSTEWQAFKKEYPTQAMWFGQVQDRTLLRTLGGLSSQQLRQILEGPGLRLPFDRAAPMQQDALTRALIGGGSTMHGPISEVTVTLQRDGGEGPEMLDFAYGFRGVEGKVHLNTGHASVLRGLGGPSRDEAEKTAERRQAAWKRDPLLSAVVPSAKESLDLSNQPPGVTNFTLWLLDLHRRTNLPFLADIYPHRVREPNGERLSLLRMEDRPLWSVLESIYPSRWRLEDGWITYRHPDWYRLRVAERRFHPRRPEALSLKTAPAGMNCCDQPDPDAE